MFAEIKSKLPDVENWLCDVKKNAAVAIARNKKFEDTAESSIKSAKKFGNAEVEKDTRHTARVLVVDDSAVSREVAAEFVGELVTTVEFANDGNEALDKWSDGKYDVILMDCEMVPMSGIEATKRIRAKEEEQNTGLTPIIALTGNVLVDQHDEAIAAGMNDYLTKPYTPEALEKALTKWVDPDTRIAALNEASEKMHDTANDKTEEAEVEAEAQPILETAAKAQTEEAEPVVETVAQAEVEAKADTEESVVSDPATLERENSKVGEQEPSWSSDEAEKTAEISVQQDDCELSEKAEVHTSSNNDQEAEKISA